MVKVWLAKNPNGTIFLFTSKPHLVNNVWQVDLKTKYIFVDDIWVIARFDIIPDMKYAYEVEITEEEFKKFNWYA